MTTSPALVFRRLFVLWALTSVYGVEIDDKLAKLGTESSETVLGTLDPDSSEAIVTLLIESSDEGASICPPNTKCLLLNLILGPATSLVSVPVVPVIKGKPVSTSFPIVPVIKGKPTQSSVPLVPVVKGLPVKPVVPLVPVIKGKRVSNTSPVTRKPFQRGSTHRRTKPKVITLCCFEIRTDNDYLGRPCHPSYFQVVTSKPARPTTVTVRIHSSSIYPLNRYPGTQPPASYPSNRYPGTQPPVSYPSNRYPGSKPPVSYPSNRYPGSKPPVSYPSNRYPGSKPPVSYPSGSYPSNRYPGTQPPASYPSNRYPGTQPPASYPSNRYPGTQPPASYPSNRYPGSKPAASYPSDRYPGTYPAGYPPTIRPRPARPPSGGVVGSPWSPLVPSTQTVVKVDGKLGLSSDADASETGDSQGGGKIDGKLGAFQ